MVQAIFESQWRSDGHDYIVGTLDVLQACDACADMGMTYSVRVQCTDCVVFPSDERQKYDTEKMKWQSRTCKTRNE